MGQCLASMAACCLCSIITSAVSSICSACCGNDSMSGSSARIRSVLLFILAVGISFGFQYGVAPKIENDINIPLTGIDEYLRKSWTDGCQGYATQELREKCVGNTGVYRVTSATFLFYALSALISLCRPTFNREMWIVKVFAYLALVTGTIFIPNEPLFTPIFMNLSRGLAAIFIIFQQVIIVDMAYNINEHYVAKADQAEAEEGQGKGNKWLMLLLVLSGFFFALSVTIIGLLYGYFLGCGTNAAFISITLVLGLLCSAIQLTGEEASLFTSMAIFLYTSFLCYTAVSKNPDGSCNPKLGDEDVPGIIFGITITIISLAWTGWSATAPSTVGNSSETNKEVDQSYKKAEEVAEEGTKDVKGVVVGDDETSQDAQTSNEAQAPIEDFGDSWKLNAILILVTCWFAMTVTSWGSVEDSGNSANPDVGKVSMWMIISSQWLCFTLYLWTLLAPKILKNRDFSR